MCIKIVSGKKGWHLKVNGLWINHGYEPKVVAIENETGVPYGATEFVSVEAIRRFWNTYRLSVMGAIIRPHISVWGQLKFIDKATV